MILRDNSDIGRPIRMLIIINTNRNEVDCVRLSMFSALMPPLNVKTITTEKILPGKLTVALFHERGRNFRDMLLLIQCHLGIIHAHLIHSSFISLYYWQKFLCLKPVVRTRRSYQGVEL
jgi:hypothetical protein